MEVLDIKGTLSEGVPAKSHQVNKVTYSCSLDGRTTASPILKKYRGKCLVDADGGDQEEKEVNAFISKLAESLGAVFARHSVGELTNGVLNPRTLANIMSAPDIKGPPSFKINGRVCFETQSFLAWLVESGRVALNK